MPTPDDVQEFGGPGGKCPLLVQVVIGDGEPIEGLWDDGDTVTCSDRKPPEGG